MDVAYRNLTTARASPRSDARHSPSGVPSMLGLPTHHGRRRLKKLVQNGNDEVPKKKLPMTRFATLNVGSMTGRAAEVAAALKERRIDVCAVQETRWAGAKSRDIGAGYKLLFNGSPRTTSGVGIIVSERYRDAVAEVYRYDDRLMKIIFVINSRRMHFFSAYAPQSGCTMRVKDDFWSLLDSETAAVPMEECLVIAGDLNGHVGELNNGHPSHGGFGYGRRNDDGERILDYAGSHNLILLNTWYKKRCSQLATYHSGDASSQIDFFLMRSKDRTLVNDAKVIPYETVATQHRPLVCTLRIDPPKQQRPDLTGPARIKWWNFTEKASELINRIHLPRITSVEESWDEAKTGITGVARSVLGTTKPGRRYLDKETWLWTDEVRMCVRKKKALYHNFLKDKTPAKWKEYQVAKSEAKKAVARTKTKRFEDLYRKLDTRDGERDLYKLVRSRNRKTEDVEKFFGINDENGRLLSNAEQAKERWRQYFEKISTEEFPHPLLPHAMPVLGAIPLITSSEVAEALKAMKSGKTTGPDDIAAEIWKSRLWNPTHWLASLFNRIVAERRIPSDWRSSTTVPIFKKKGSPADCCNYRPIRLLSHTMKIFERILDKRIRDVVELSVNQCGFVQNCGTTDAIHSTRLLVEKHREKGKAVHLAFLDLEKAFDRVPHDVIWYALRSRNVPEELIDWVKFLYVNPTSCIRAVAGTSTPFRITVGVHQGSALSPLLFIVVMDAITRDLQRPAPWTLLYADDVMLASEDKHDLQLQVQAWHDRLAHFGLRLNKKKTEYMTNDAECEGSIQVDNTELPKTSAFRYLGSTLNSSGTLADEIEARITTAWSKWRAASGVLCDRKVSDRLKSKIYRTVVRPVALYGTECWPITKEVERRLGVMETKMLRWSGGLTRLDRVRNEDVRERFGVAPISDKLRENRLRWYGHVLRAEEHSIAKTAMQLEVTGPRPKGRPKQRWLDVLHNDMKFAGLHPDNANDKVKWRQRSRKADPATMRDKR